MKWKLHENEIYKPTPKELAKNREFIEKCEELGIELGILTEGIEYSKDEIEAIDLISKGQEVPEDIRQRLLAAKCLKEKVPSLDIDKKAIDNKLKALLGDKFDI